MRQGLYTLLLFSSVCTLTACGKKKKSEEKGPKRDGPTVVDVMIAAPERITDTITANGTVIASEFLEIRPEVSGRLTYLNLTEGSTVPAGTVIARINDADLRAQISKSQVQLDLALKTQQRYKTLMDAGGLNASDYDLISNQVNTYRADMQYTRTLIDKTVIRAPFNAVIGLRQVSPGAYVTPQTVLSTLQQVSQLKIDFTLPEAYASSVKNGQVVNVEIDKQKELFSSAYITAIEPSADQGTRNIRVRALLADNNAVPGAFVKVYIDAGNSRPSIMVPSNALIPNEKSNQLIVVKDSTAVFTDVKTGLRRADNIEITSGISAGDTIVVTGVLFARPKSKVKVRAVKRLNEVQSDTAKVAATPKQEGTR